MDTNTTSYVHVTAEERRATAEALKIARSTGDARPILRSLQVKDGRAFVTDSYRAVMLPWFDALPDGCYDADGLYAALKGAGKDRARITVEHDLSGDVSGVTVTRFDTGTIRVDVDELPDDLGTFARGTFPVASIDGTPPNVTTIWNDAVERIGSDEYVPELAPVNGDFLAAIVKCHPAYFEGGPANRAVTVHPCGLKPAVVANGKPYALLMPMRIS